MAKELINLYPNIKLVATTIRNVKNASINDFGAICYTDNEVYKPLIFKDLNIMDRIGSGDAFATGLIYGILQDQKNIEKAMKYGIINGALAMTTQGDTSMANLKEIEEIINGKDASIQR